MRNHELVGIPLLFGKGCAELYSLFGVSDHNLKGGFSCSNPHGGNHEPRVPKNHVSLFHPVARHTAQEILDRDKDVGKGKRRCIRSTYSVFFFGLSLVKSFHAFFYNKKSWAFGSFGQDREKISVSAI